MPTAIGDRFTRARVLVLAEKFTAAGVFPLLRLGAQGLLRYEEAREQLPQAIRAVAACGFGVPRSLFSRFGDAVLSELRARHLADLWGDLSRREREVLDALLEKFVPSGQEWMKIRQFAITGQEGFYGAANFTACGPNPAQCRQTSAGRWPGAGQRLSAGLALAVALMVWLLATLAKRQK